MLARKLAVLATGVAAGLAFATPAQAAGASVDFGQKELGQSETKAITVQLTATAGDIDGALSDAIDDNDFAPLVLAGAPQVELTGAEVKAVLLEAVDKLSNSSKFSFEILGLEVSGNTDFTVDDGCDGKDGKDTATCEINATFAPAADGPRSAKVNANIDWTGGQGELTEAFAAAALTVLPEPLNQQVSDRASAAINALSGDLESLLKSVYNPVIELKGTGIAPGSGGGGGQTPSPPPGNGGGGNGGGGSQLPQTGVKVAELAAGGAALLVLGFGIVFLARRRQNA
ncbi:MAG TPA: hypothetical protein DGT23_01080 [Micromonosporaceae bacterium]|nr:hypothetical protein [Micromonosporaceae bacterium]